MKKLHTQSTLPVLFVVAALIMIFGGGRLAAIGEQIGAPVLVFDQKTRGSEGGNSQAAGAEDQEEHDLGDAPDSSNSFPGASMLAYPATGVAANYPTIYWTGFPPYGPIHWQPNARIYLGRAVTSESRADYGYDEDPDNNLKPPDDLSDLDGGDDGVQLPLVLPNCQEATFDYTVTVVSYIYSSAYVNVWCDWNRDGDWDDTLICTRGQAPEWAVQNQQLLFTGPGTFNITTSQFMCWHPETKGELDPMWMRITVSLQPWEAGAGAAVSGGSGPAGGYEYGETEDYFIYPRKEIGPDEYDWGDAPDNAAATGYPTLSTNNGASHVIAGPWLGDENDKPDSELDGQPDNNALGDNNYDKDDENGATIPTLIRGETADITLDVSGGGGIVQGWIDFNGDKSWQATEKIYDGFLSNGSHSISLSVPIDAVLGQTFARFRISTKGGLSPEGPALDGEVEDHEVFVEEPPRDNKWVQWPDLTRNGIDIRVDYSDNRYRRIADDFECTNNNRITTVTLWGSWKNDEKGKIKQIHLSIYSDDPPGPGGEDAYNSFSKPGSQPLWDGYFSSDDFHETLYHVVRSPGEWWWDPVTGEYGPGGDTEVWRVDIYIEPDEAFLQYGSPDNPVIYWLEANINTEEGEFGWKTRSWPDHYMDDAVWDVGFKPPRAWKELRYPKTHPYHEHEKNSIDMAFQLMYTDEGPGQPTSRPVSATQCPTVDTQCPSVATRCPPFNTKCPVAATKCPAVQTQCVAVTMCPPVNTTCPVAQTTCPAEQTKCPSVMTSCPPTSTICQGGQTQCPTVYTQCPAELTECPSSDTSCPSMHTYCPEEYTLCPAQQTTKCPSVSTKCPPMSTRCPAVNTQCPTVNTECPPVPTECPTVDTECPPEPTNCPAIDTECPPEPTNCPEEYTECPVVSTRCPAIHTLCPKTTTACEQVDTMCPQDPTRCPGFLTWCFQVPTECPLADTLCPETHTQCPPVDTQCPLTESVCVCIIETFQPGCPMPLTVFPLCRDGTKNFSAAVLGNCPAIDVQAPTVVPEYLLKKARRRVE